MLAVGRALTIFQNDWFCTRISNFFQSPILTIARRPQQRWSTPSTGSVCRDHPSARCCPPFVWGSSVAYPAPSSPLLCLWRTAVCATLWSRCSRGRHRAETRRQRVDTIFLFLSSSCNMNTYSYNVCKDVYYSSIRLCLKLLPVLAFGTPFFPPQFVQ